MNNERLRSRPLIIGRLGSSMRRRREEDEKKKKEEINEAGLKLFDNIIKTILDLLERPSTLLQRKRTYISILRTPAKPATPPQLPPPRASSPIEEDLHELPIFTTPARLTLDSRPRRERVKTERATIARRVR
jgi:hypothetical protein